MNTSPGKGLASVVLCAAALACGSTAQAMAPLPKTLIDRPVRAPHARLEVQKLLPDWVSIDPSGTLADDEALGYFCESVRSLAERFDGSPGRHLAQGRDDGNPGRRLAYAYGHSKKGDRKPHPRQRPDEPGGPRGGNSFGHGKPSSPPPVYVDQPMFPEPIHAGFGKREAGASGRGTVPEPSSQALLAIALTGLLVSSRRGKSR